MRNPIHPNRDQIELSSVLYALSDPIRLSIVKSIIKNGRQSCGALELPVAKSTASHHFRVLRESGILKMEAEGTQFMNSIREQELNDLFPNLLNTILSASK